MKKEGEDMATDLTCRFCEESTPNVRCGLSGMFFVSMPERHKFVVCNEHVKRYSDGKKGRKRSGGRYIIQSISEGKS